jgi:hypothetical protein
MGLISPTLPTIGQLNATEDADLLDSLQTIVNEINGNIDSSNLGTLDDLTFGAGAVLTWAGDTDLFRNAANQLGTNDDLIARAGGAKVFVGEAGPGGEAGIAFGAASDTNLYRGGASLLATDDDFVVKPGTVDRVYVGDVGTDQPGLVLGSAADTNLYRLAANQLASDDDLIARASGERVFIGTAGPSGQAGISLGAASDTNLYRLAASQLGTDDDFKAANGWMLAHHSLGQKVVSGRVSAAGAVVSGAGFSASRTSTGVYVVDFTPDFAAAPAVLVTPSGTAAPFHATFVATPAAGSVTVEIVAPDGTTPLNAAFNFVAVGA